MSSDEPRQQPRIRIRQTAKVVIDTTDPVTIRGVTAYDSDGTPVGRVGIEAGLDENDE